VSYVLVSLVGVNDEATQTSDAFATWYAGQHAPGRHFSGEAPDHQAISEAVLALDAPRGFVLGHGGENLRALPGRGPLEFLRPPVIVWAEAEQFAAIFRGARVYVFACSTLAEAADDMSFGREAVRLGVASYAGHFKPIQAPGIGDVGLHDKQLRRAIARVVKKFLDGCDDVAELLMEARSAISHRARVPLTPTPGGFNDALLGQWTLDWQRILGSLKVELGTRAPLVASERGPDSH
jgi:hypothetical protein